MADEKPQKTSLKDLLTKVTDVAFGKDEKGRLPNDEEYDASSAPSGTMRWCASIMRIFLLRVVEADEASFKAVSGIRSLLTDPDLKKGDPWRSDLPSIRERLAKVEGVTEEILKAIKLAGEIAVGGAPATGATDGSAPPSENKTSEASEDALRAAQDAEMKAVAEKLRQDMLAQMAARGSKVTTPVVPTPAGATPTPPVVPITTAGNKTPKTAEKA